MPILCPKKAHKKGLICRRRLLASEKAVLLVEWAEQGLYQPMTKAMIRTLYTAAVVQALLIRARWRGPM